MFLYQSSVGRNVFGGGDIVSKFHSFKKVMDMVASFIVSFD